MDTRQCMWCLLEAQWCCRASTDGVCGPTGATRRRTSRQTLFAGKKTPVQIKFNTFIRLHEFELKPVSNTCFHGLQVVHWDRQSPGVYHDRADRLVDLYASGEQRSYGPLFLQRKMNISNQAFAEGDFSLSISDLQVCLLCQYNECNLTEEQKTLQEPGSFKSQAKIILPQNEVNFPPET